MTQICKTVCKIQEYKGKFVICAAILGLSVVSGMGLREDKGFPTVEMPPEQYFSRNFCLFLRELSQFLFPLCLEIVDKSLERCR